MCVCVDIPHTKLPSAVVFPLDLSSVVKQTCHIFFIAHNELFNCTPSLVSCLFEGRTLWLAGAALHTSDGSNKLNRLHLALCVCVFGCFYEAFL